MISIRGPLSGRHCSLRQGMRAPYPFSCREEEKGKGEEGTVGKEEKGIALWLLFIF